MKITHVVAALAALVLFTSVRAENKSTLKALLARRMQTHWKQSGTYTSALMKKGTPCLRRRPGSVVVAHTMFFLQHALLAQRTGIVHVTGTFQKSEIGRVVGL